MLWNKLLFSSILFVSMALFVASAPTFYSLTHYFTSPTNGSFNLQQMNIDTPRGPVIEISSKPNLDMMLYQHNVFGFGAAMTDATIDNLVKMDPKTQMDTLEALFGTNSLNAANFNFIRITLGPSDFSADVYDYLGKSPDYNLTTFSLAKDEKKIEILKKVKWLQPKLKIVTSPWSALPWMKEERTFCGSQLAEKYMSLYADYLIKYLTAYKAVGIELDYITVQNEPLFKTPLYPSMFMDWSQQLRFLKIMESKMPKDLNTKCLIYDHNWGKPGEDFVTNFMKDQWAYNSQFIEGIAWHGYEGNADSQLPIRKAFPKKRQIFTEITASIGDDPKETTIWQWNNLFYGSTRNFGEGVVYWNMILDENSGPSLRKDSWRGRGFMTYLTFSNQVCKEIDYFNFGHFSYFVGDKTVFVDGKKVTGTDVSYMWFANYIENPEAGAAPEVESEFVVIFNENRNKAATVSLRLDGAAAVNVQLAPVEMSTIQIRPGHMQTAKKVIPQRK